MSMKPRIGYIKTFSSGLGSGSAEVEIGGKAMSLPFTSSAVRGNGTQVRSGDRVHVTLRTEKGKPRVVAIEPAPPTPTGSGDEPESAESSMGMDMMAPLVPVLPDGGTKARFTKENFVRSGSRLDFS